MAFLLDILVISIFSFCRKIYCDELLVHNEFSVFKIILLGEILI